MACNFLPSILERWLKTDYINVLFFLGEVISYFLCGTVRVISCRIEVLSQILEQFRPTYSKIFVIVHL